MIITLFIKRKYSTGGYSHSDENYEEYSCEFDNLESAFLIQFKTANPRLFPYDTQKEIDQARVKKLDEMLAKLKNELETKFKLREHYHFKINREEQYRYQSYSTPNISNSTVTITASGIKEICYRAIQASLLSVKDIPAEILPRIAAPAPQSINLKSVNIPEETLDYYQAMLYLDQYIFSQPRRMHSEKAGIINFVEAIFKKVKNTDDLCKLYDYITLGNNKEKINIHYHNISDTIFFWKSNTSSWQTMISNIRKHAYSTFIDEVNKKEIVEKELRPLDIYSEDGTNTTPHPQDQLAYFRKYNKQKLFTEHRTNNPLSFIYNTKTTKAINRNIAKLEEISDKVTFEPIAIR